MLVYLFVLQTREPIYVVTETWTSHLCHRNWISCLSCHSNWNRCFVMPAEAAVFGVQTGAAICVVIETEAAVFVF